MIKKLEKPIRVTEQEWPDNITPFVSVSCLAYNHSNYIKEAIEGFLIQKTTFPIEILIHDDASTDDTADIIREYEAKYPNLIKPIYQKENQYQKKDGSLRRVQRERVSGVYYATCEGDDFWIDPLKLQKQVVFLEANPEYVLVHTDYNYKNQETGEITEAIHASQQDLPDEEDNCAPFIISDRYHVATCTALYRFKDGFFIDTKFAHDFDSRYVMGDYQKWFHLARLGKLKYLPDVTATYRRNAGSATAFFDYEKRLVFIEKVYWQRRTFAERYGYPEQLPLIHFNYLRNLAFLKYRINGHNKNNEYYEKFKALDNVSLLSLIKLWGSFCKYRLKKILKKIV